MRLIKSNDSLSDTVKDAIIALITTETFPDNKLPAESKLAEHFGVSLPVVREALLLLREEGVVTKKHGSGNYFHLSALKTNVRIDKFKGGFRHWIKAMGYESGDSIVKLEVAAAPPKAYDGLKLGREEPILHYERQLFADGVPAVHCDNYLPIRFFRKPYADFFQAPLSIAQIIGECFHKEMAYGNLEFIPYLTTREEGGQICAPPGQPIIIMAETYYSLEDIPVAYSMNKFNHAILPINLFSR